MGYCIEMVDSKFTIKKHNFNLALDALKKVFIPENMTCYDYLNKQPMPHFSWVCTESVLNCETLGEALSEIRYCPIYDKDGNIVRVIFEGEKYGDENIFFSALAKYVEPDSYIRFVGEDGAKWIWWFDNEEVDQLYKRPAL